MAASGKEYSTEKIRNVAVLGHGGSGKTTLVDALCFAAGSSRRKGSVEERHALTMTTPEELDHGISLQTTPAFAEFLDTKINLLDTPGYLDFTGDAMAAVRVADAALIVVGATSGVEVGTEVVWNYCESRSIPRMFFMSMMDKEHADFDKVFADVKERLAPNLLPVEIPIGQGDDFRGIINLFSEKAHVFKEGTLTGEFEETDIPEELEGKFEEMVTEFIETIATTELLLASGRFREALTGDRRPDLVLRLGEAPIGWAGRRLAAAWAEAGVKQIAIDPWGRRLDPEHGLTRLLVGDPAALFAAVAARIKHCASGRQDERAIGAIEPGWLAFHRAADRAAREALDEAVSGEEELFDGGVFWHLGRALPEDTALVVSSSMPLRELEIFLPACPGGPVDVFANRGHNGIDGVTATALGVALGRRALGRSRTVLVTGDVAFVHDLSGALAAGRLREHADPVLVLVDNGGGAIFDHLPAAGHEPGFTRHLATPPGADFAALALGCGFAPQGGYQAPESWSAFRRIVETAISIGDAGPRLIHLRTDRMRSKALRQAIIDRVASIVDRAVERVIDRTGAEAAKGWRREPGRPAELAPVESVEQVEPRTGDSTIGRTQRTEDPLLFLHGFTGSRCDWIDWIGRIDWGGTRRRFAGHPALAIDLPGHGLAPVPAAGATMDEAIAAVLRTLDREGAERAHLVGYSMGGRVSLATAVRHPERVASLVLIGATAGIENTKERSARRDQDEALARSIEQDGLEAFIDRWMAQSIFASQLRLGHRVLRQARLGRLRGSTRGYAAALSGMGQGTQSPLWKSLESLEVPVLLIAGARDEKYTHLAHAMADLIPNARVEIVPATGHAVHLEAPEAVSRLLEDWLG